MRAFHWFRKSVHTGYMPASIITSEYRPAIVGEASRKESFDSNRSEPHGLMK